MADYEVIKTGLLFNLVKSMVLVVINTGFDPKNLSICNTHEGLEMSRREVFPTVQTR